LTCTCRSLGVDPEHLDVSAAFHGISLTKHSIGFTKKYAGAPQRLSLYGAYAAPCFLHSR